MATMQRQSELNESANKALDEFWDLLLELGSVCEECEQDVDQNEMTWERLGTLQSYVSTIREMLGKVD